MTRLVVQQVEDLAAGLADEEIFKVEALLVECHERVLADRAHFDHLCQFAGALKDLDYQSRDDDLGLLSLERDLHFFLLLGSNHA